MRPGSFPGQPFSLVASGWAGAVESSCIQQLLGVPSNACVAATARDHTREAVSLTAPLWAWLVQVIRLPRGCSYRNCSGSTGLRPARSGPGAAQLGDHHTSGLGDGQALTDQHPLCPGRGWSSDGLLAGRHSNPATFLLLRAGSADEAMASERAEARWLQLTWLAVHDLEGCLVGACWVLWPGQSQSKPMDECPGSSKHSRPSTRRTSSGWGAAFRVEQRLPQASESRARPSDVDCRQDRIDLACELADFACPQTD